MAGRSPSGGTARRWSGDVTRNSNALDLDNGVFTLSDPVVIARSLKHSAERSRRRKGTAYQSAMSMLNFYVNRAGDNLPASRRRVLEKAKLALRKVFGRVPSQAHGTTSRR
jgi:hypothetical protein